MHVTRRWLLTVGWCLAIGAGGTMACAERWPARASDDQTQGRLRARPARGSASRAPSSPSSPASSASSSSASSASPLAPGEQRLSLGTGRDGLLVIPRDVPAGTPLPLVVLLHGATGSAKGIATRMGAAALADRYRMVVLAPDSRGRTWDAAGGELGPDVAFLDSALEQLFARVAIDRAHIAIAGFSDGASYALSLGLINGDLFTHIIAFSPGFIAGDRREGRPAIFISHGTQDEILPIDTTSRRIAPSLRRAGYTLQYREFDGPHTVPPAIAQEAFDWMLGKPAAPADGGHGR